jgi:hypothetical protein
VAYMDIFEMYLILLLCMENLLGNKGIFFYSSFIIEVVQKFVLICSVNQ